MLEIRNEFFDAVDASGNRLIEDFLRESRDIVPIDFNAYITLSNILSDEDSPDIDPILFIDTIEKAQIYFTDKSPNFTLLPFERYMIRKAKDDDIGGFHGKVEEETNLNAGGYRYFNDLGFGRHLNPQIVPNMSIRTYELARNYLHDTMHASSFRAFKVTDTGEIYRSQYGVNFRDAQGRGYSSPKTTKDGQSINLNVLMEGVIQKIIGEFIAETFPDDNAKFSCPSTDSELSAIEREVWNDITLTGKYRAKYVPQMNPFYSGVMKPTDCFLACWDPETDKINHSGTPLRFKIFHAMMSGDLCDVHSFMDNAQYGECRSGQAWTETFRQASFEEDISLSSTAIQNKDIPEYIPAGSFGYVKNHNFKG